MEMEIPNGTPDNPQQVSLSTVKQEKVGKEGSRVDGRDEMSKSKTKQNTTGEAQRMET